MGYVEQDLFGSISLVDITQEELKAIRVALQEQNNSTSKRLVGIIDRYFNSQEQ